MNRVTRVAIGAATSLACLSVPMLATSASGSDADSIPTTVSPATVDTKPEATGSVSTIDVSTMDPDGLVDQARAGLADYTGGFTVDQDTDEISLSDCPLVSVDEFTAAIAPIGDASAVAADVSSYVDIEEFDPEDAENTSVTSQVALGVACDTDDGDEVRPGGATGGVYGFGVGAFEYGVAPEDIDIVEALTAELDTVVEPSVDTLGGTVYLGCVSDFDDDEEDGDTVTCLSFWERDRFIIGMYAVVDSETQEQALATLEDVSLGLYPMLIQRLADGLPEVDVVAEED